MTTPRWTLFDIEDALAAMYDAYVLKDTHPRQITRETWITTRALTILQNLMNEPELIHYDLDEIARYRQP